MIMPPSSARQVQQNRYEYNIMNCQHSTANTQVLIISISEIKPPYWDIMQRKVYPRFGNAVHNTVYHARRHEAYIAGICLFFLSSLMYNLAM